MNSLKAEADWKTEWRSSFTRLDDLLDYLELPLERMDERLQASKQFAFRVTRSYAGRIKKGDPSDPLLRQILPAPEELVVNPGFLADPVGDGEALAVPGLLHKYQGRALLIAAGTCAIQCRYCFRRGFPYAENHASHNRQQQALAYIRQTADIAEVILSGGDPLVLNDARLRALIGHIADIPQVQRLRIHSRMPIALPSRITKQLARILASTRLQPVLVIHANHANELDGAVGHGLQRLHRAGIVLLNQSVLLKGVNDTALALAGLSETLFSHQVLPYYLHLLDKASGTTHFEIDEKAALKLHEQLRRLLPGYLVPRLVREIPREPYKILM